ncbi:carbohydrate ABC transporter permease [Mycetocola spongiae]|uniref:carbohydrate ABC transporter permease n=1 Tax=Mycetocola spongiae TaxID=2859226 RepID=UPI001CF4BDE3|nr:carbohydrate ABC transporter permease [Mycetocola spongiae]UCR88655.1 carbohydrate ABC transporter permease [Mycetocola spongiae]
MTVTAAEITARPRRLPGRKKARGPQSFIGTTLSYAFLAVLTFTAILPLAVMLATSFKPAAEIFAIPPKFLASNPTIANYVTVLAGSEMPRALLNSVSVGVLTTIVTLILGCSTGYALSRFRFRGARPLAITLLLGQLLPATVLLLPIYKLIAGLGLLDTIPGLSIAMLVFVLPVVTWMLSSTFNSVPIELEEAAMIDGSTRFMAVIRVVLPVAAPGIASVGIFAFLQSWNEFLFASVMTTSIASKTAPIALTDFANEFTVDWGATMAGASVISVPITIVFLFVQRFFVRGMAAGAVKG